MPVMLWMNQYSRRKSYVLDLILFSLSNTIYGGEEETGAFRPCQLA